LLITGTDAGGRWLYSQDLASYLDNAGRECEAGVGRGHVVQQGRVRGDGGDDGVVSQGGDLTKHSTKIDMEF
jgi:hypothetical protein